MADYDFPDHIGWRVIASLAAILVVTEVFTAVAIPRVPLWLFLVLELPLAFTAGWFAGKWAFRSKLPLRSALPLIWRAYRDDRG